MLSSINPQKIIRTQELAEQLGIAAGTIHNQWKSQPHKFPPLTILPGQRGPAWLQSDVDDWLLAHRSAQPASRRRVGRPTKKEQRQRMAG
jgi:predicted DNA-binding transcriptional regulator AlpA